MARVVLVVDDEPMVRFLIADYLAEVGLSVLEAESAHAALDVLEQNDGVTDLVTDVKMPGSLDGIDLARIVNERWSHISTVVVSGHAAAGDPRLPSNVGFMHKPFTRDALLTVLGSRTQIEHRG